jgi:hypothetical protein
MFELDLDGVFDELLEQLQPTPPVAENIALSSSGRTAVSGTANGGSNPSEAASL